MIEARHTPGKWRAEGGHVLASLDDDRWSTVFVADCGPLHDNAERIAECVNGCDGIDPAAVPDLLRVLQRFVTVNRTGGYEFDSNEPKLFTDIEDAIRRATGEATT